MEETRRFELVRAQDCDADTCMAVLSEGRAFQQEQGFVQWSDRYPALQDVVSDISLGTGFKLIDGGRIAAYVCLDPFGEEAYKHIKGAWHTSDPYIVIRRISFARDYAGRGLSGMLLLLHVLRKNGASEERLKDLYGRNIARIFSLSECDIHLPDEDEVKRVFESLKGEYPFESFVWRA